MTDAPEIPEGLRPANENPWYILMTLHGDGSSGTDSEANREDWNTWAGQGMDEQDRARILDAIGVPLVDFATPCRWSDKEPEIRGRFASVWRERNGSHLPVPELPKPSHTIDFSNTHFEKRFTADEMYFPSSIVKFTGARFDGISEFCGAHFRGKVQGSRASFQSDFFARKARFDMGVDFFRAKFSSLADFADTCFCAPASFTRARFGGDALFVTSKFHSSSKFSESEFEKDADFRSTVFNAGARFERTSFRDVASFAGGEFHAASTPSKSIAFSHSVFERPTSFRQALFFDGYPDLSGAVLHDKTSFTARMDPTSDEIALDKDLEGRTFWPQRTKQDPVSARESCATIRHVLTQQGLPEEAHFFFRREMRFASQIGSFWQRLPYLLFGWLSDFGYSIQRPLWWLAGIWFLGMAAFWTVFSFPGGPPVLSESDLGTAAALSFSNLFPLFGFGRVLLSEVLASLPRWAQVLSGAQTVLSLPLLFFLGLALRQRFRLR